VVQKIEEEIPVEVVQSTQKQTPETELLINSFDIKKIVVNIMCLEKTSAYTKLSSGSGVIISDSGIVLTNAHVAYPLLFSKQFGNNTYTCSIRRSDLPSFGYNAELIYYPVDWLSYNSEIIKDPTPIGTGENDYALVAMTSPISLAPSSTGLSYASTAVSYSDLRSGSSITVSGYPSTNSGVFEVDVNPGLKTAQTYIDDFFTFASKSFDILKTGVNQVAQRGSSGGGVFKDDKLYGIVVTTNQSSEGAHLNALTIPYIKRDFKNDTGTDFDDFILTPISTLKAQFITSYQPRLQSIISGN